jgi:serine/threonine protein kinase
MVASNSGANRVRRSPSQLTQTDRDTHGGYANGKSGKMQGAEMNGASRSQQAIHHPQQQQHQQQQSHSQYQQVLPSAKNLIVNRRPYARLDLIGKGGSSRVYRVMNAQNEIFAIKRVALDKTDDETIGGYMNEIALLKRLEGNHRIIRLVDSEVKGGGGSSKGNLMLVMECGEVGEFVSLCCCDFAWMSGFCADEDGQRFGSIIAGTTKGAHEYGLDRILLATGTTCFPSYF